MTDGHTKAGSYKVTLTLTGDMLEQLIRVVDLIKMMNGRDFDTQKRPETFDVLAYREFLKEIATILYKATEGHPRITGQQ